MRKSMYLLLGTAKYFDFEMNSHEIELSAAMARQSLQASYLWIWAS